MYRFKKLILSALCMCIISAVFSGTAVVNAAAINLPSGFLIGDQDGIHVDASGEYYIDARDLKPGDVIHTTLTIQNLAQNDKTPEGKVPYTLVMRTEPLTNSGPVDLLDEVSLTLKLDGETVYDGRVRGDGVPNMIEKALELGDYAVGDRRILDITLTVSPEMKQYEEISEADFKWVFYAYRAVDADPPKTGLLDGYWMYLLPIAGAVLLSALLLLMKKRRERQARPAVNE